VALAGFAAGRRSITAAVWLLLPAGLTVSAGLLTEAFSKFLLVAVPAGCLLGGYGLASGYPLWQRGGLGWRSLAVLIGVGAVVWGDGLYQSLYHLYYDPRYFRDDYRGVARYVDSIARPGDALITLAPNQIEALGYYHRSGAPVFPLPRTRPLDRETTRLELETIVAHYQRLFVLYWGDDQADPEHFIEDWLNTHTFKAGDRWFGGVRLATYAAATPASAPATLSGAHFGSQIVLEGYTLSNSRLAVGDILQVTFFWRASEALPTRYKVFVHLYADSDQPPCAQEDGEPGGGMAITTTWQPGEVYADNHGVLITAEVSPGNYRLMAGLYAWDSGARLPVTLDGVMVGDRLDLGMVTVASP